MLLHIVSRTVVLALIYARVLARPGDVADTNSGEFQGNSDLDLQTTPVITTEKNAYDVGRLKPAFTARTMTIFNPQNIRSMFFTIERPNQTIVFDDIITNTGSHYSPATGVFVAPVAGQYYFTTSVKDVSNHGGTVLHIVVNGSRVAEVSTMYYSANQGQSRGDSNSVVLELNAGDEVYVRSYNAGGKITGSFTGFQL